VIPVQCPLGFYSLSTETKCTPCPAGSYCPDQFNSPIAVTGSLHYAEARSTYQSKVPPGYEFTTTSTPPVQCPLGTWWQSSDATCQKCEAGKFCPDPKQRGKLACPQGTTAVLDNQVACDPCPAGFTCADPSVAPVECGQGRYSLGYSFITPCTECPAGYMCPNKHEAPSFCPTGTYSAAG
jgi:hypothetical protein